MPQVVGMGIALDLILTGRAMDAEEALRIGLASRVVPTGTALESAQQLAAQLAAMPQECMRNDRLSALNAWGSPMTEAMATEFAYGQQSLAAGAEQGASKFAAGAGRHGSPSA